MHPKVPSEDFVRHAVDGQPESSALLLQFFGECGLDLIMACWETEDASERQNELDEEKQNGRNPCDADHCERPLIVRTSVQLMEPYAEAYDRKHEKNPYNHG